MQKNITFYRLKSLQNCTKVLYYKHTTFGGNMKFTTNSAKETELLGEKIAKNLVRKDIIAYSGDLGAGKTALTRGIMRGLGYKDRVTSPTFAIVHEYLLDDFSVCHFDMYRILDDDALYDIGFDDYLSSDSILIIEWSENIINSLPKDIIYIDMKNLGDDTREIILGGKYENFSF